MSIRSWLGKLMALRLTAEPRQPDERRIPYSGRTSAGVYITPARALTNATVWAAHRYLTQTVGQLPVRVMRLSAGSGSTSEQVFSHPVDNVLNWRTNPELGPFQFKETMVGWALLHGNGVAEIERDAVGRVVNLWPIHPDRIDFRRDVETGDLLYRVNNGTVGTADLRSSDVFHLRAFGDGPVGLSVVEYAAQSIGWAKAAELFGASYFGNGLNVGGAIEGAANMDPDAIARLLERIDQRHGGPGRAHRPLILDGGLTWKKTTSTPDESQFVATMQHQVEEVCRWFGVPPQKVHHLLRMTFNNVEQLSIEVVVDAITPWAIRFEEEANAKLFGQNRKSFFVKLDLKGLLRGDFKTRQEGLQIQRRNGVINADYWSEVEDMPKPGRAAGGQIYIVEGNMTTLDQVGQKPEPAPAPAAVEPPVPANDDAALAALAEVSALLDMESVDAA